MCLQFTNREKKYNILHIISLNFPSCLWIIYIKHEILFIRKAEIVMEKEDSKAVATTDDKPITIIDQVFVTEVGDEPEDFPTSTDYYDMETQLQKEYEVALMHELKGINIQSYQNEELTRRVQRLVEVVCETFYNTP